MLLSPVSRSSRPFVPAEAKLSRGQGVVLCVCVCGGGVGDSIGILPWPPWPRVFVVVNVVCCLQQALRCAQRLGQDVKVVVTALLTKCGGLPC
jgi:hypothetical protein